MSRRKTPGRGIFRLYLGVLVLATVLFGAVHAYAYGAIFLAVLAGSLVLLAQSVRPDVGGRALVLPWHPGMVLFLGLGLWMALQMVPLPQPLLRWISPQALVAGKMSLPAAQVVASGGETNGWMTLAPYVHPVGLSLARWVVYGLFFLGLLRLLDTRKRMETLLLLLLATGCVVALYGMMEAFSSESAVLWHPYPEGKGQVKGTFINRNHFAAYAEAVLLLGAAGVAGVTARRERVIGTGPTRLRSRLAAALSGEQRVSKRAFLLVASGVVGLGLVLSGSRGGIIAAGVGLLALGTLLAMRRGFRGKGLVILVLCGVIGVYALQTGVAYTEARFRHLDLGMEERLKLTRSVMEIAEDFPWTGVGVGNFPYAFPKYQPWEESAVFYRYGHNDWAQFLAEAGVAGAVILIAGVGYVLFGLLGRWKDRRHPYAVCTGAGGVAILLALGLHALVEFHLHIPAVFLTLCAALALASGALRLERRRGTERLRRAEVRLPWKPAGMMAAALITGLVLLTVFWVVRHVVAEGYCNTVPNSTLNRDPDPPVEEIRKAMAWDGGNAEYGFKRALALIKARDEALRTGADPGHVEAMQEEILSALEGAVRRNPLEARYHLRLGWEYTYLWRRPDYQTLWLPAADLSMERAAFFAGDKNPRIHQEMGNYWTMRSRTIYPTDQAHHAAWARACWHYGEVQKRARGKALDRTREEIRAFVWRFYPDEGYVTEALGR